MKFRLYTKSNCPYCHAAVQLLSQHQKEFETYNWRTVPVVVEITEGQEKFIGGFTDLKEYLSNGKQLLKG
jgi:glutaredoxin